MSPRAEHPVHPTGQQFELRQREQRAVAVEVGGGLRCYSASGRELLDGYGAAERCTSARGQALIPWPNRLRDGRYEFEGIDYQLPLSEPGKHNAIHGLARWANWRPVDRTERSVAMQHVLHPQDGWPFTLSLRIGYALSDEGLSVTTTATNIGDGACPFGAGAHPYLTLGTERIDELILQAPGQRHLPCDEQGIPTGSEPVDDTRFDFRKPRQIGDTVLDTGYGDLVRDGDGRARVRLATADGDRRVTLWLGEAIPT